MRKIIKHHIEGGIRGNPILISKICDVHDSASLRRGLQILDTRMGFPRPSLNVVLDSISPTLEGETSPIPEVIHL